MRGRSVKKIESLGSTKETATNKEKAIVISELRHKYSITLLLKVLEISKSSYYYAKSVLEGDDRDREIKERISTIYAENKGRYGYRRICSTLCSEGTRINHKKVQRIMNELGIHGITPKAKYKSYKGDLNGTCKNLLLDKIVIDEEKGTTEYVRNFETTRPNEKWTTDVSEFHIGAGKLYLSPILDMHTKEIISYDISEHPNFKQTVNMLEKAFEKHTELNGLIFHSDQGWQYQMAYYHKVLEMHGIKQSMSRKGNCYDNCVMENFFGKMKNEMFYGKEYTFKSLEQLKAEMEEYIRYYNEERIQIKLKGLTPVEFRNQAL